MIWAFFKNPRTSIDLVDFSLTYPYLIPVPLFLQVRRLSGACDMPTIFMYKMWFCSFVSSVIKLSQFNLKVLLMLCRKTINLNVKNQSKKFCYWIFWQNCRPKMHLRSLDVSKHLQENWLFVILIHSFTHPRFVYVCLQLSQRLNISTQHVKCSEIKPWFHAI